MTAENRKKERRKGCYGVAMQRARRARRKGLNPVLVALIFVWAFLSAPIPRRTGGRASAPDWPVTDYERGLQGPFRRRSASNGQRYRSRRPSMLRLMADLRRPAARADAAAALARRIPDPAVRTWAAERIDKKEINRLSIWVRPGRSEDAILAGWREETEASLAEETAGGDGMDLAPDRADMLRVAKLLEALAGTETVTSEGPKRPGRV